MTLKKTYLILSILISGTISYLIYNGNQKVSKFNTQYAKPSFGIADDPYGRIEFERKMLVDPATGKIPDNIRQKELKFASILPKVEDIVLGKSNGINTLTWNPRGPINRGGRTRALAIDVRTISGPNITIIAGGASGGIWKSKDNGVTWTNKLPADSIHSITCIAQDKRIGQEDTWYVGTGEAKGGSSVAGGGGFFYGDGIYKSTDNGETWSLLPSTSQGSPQNFNSAFELINNIAVSKVTGSVFAAASNTILRSTDGGANWNTVRSKIEDSHMTDVQITSTGVIYATVPSKHNDSGIWRSTSTDDGAVWTEITPTGFPFPYERNVIGIAPSNENIVYFWLYTAEGATKTQLWKYTYISDDGSGAGGNWENLTANLPPPAGSVAGINVQGAYNMVIKVKPDDANFVIIGGTNLYRSTDGFSTAVPSNGATNWIGGFAIANNVFPFYSGHHPDQHALVFSYDPIVLYSGSDGGVHVTTDVTAENVIWSDLSTGYITSQFYAIDIDPNTSGDSIIAGGMQDNGNYITFSTNFNTNWIDWKHGADGAFTAVRKTGISPKEYTIYLEAQQGLLRRQTYNGSGILQTDNFIKPPYTANFAFINPFILDPNRNWFMYFAQGDSVLRSSDVNTVTPTWQVLTNATTGGSVTALAVSKAPTANRLYVGGSNGKILKLTGADQGNPPATDISTGKGLPAGGYVSCIWVNPVAEDNIADQDNIIAVFSNYNVQSIWLSRNGGNSWSDISGNLEANPDGSGNGPSCRWVTAVTVGGQKTYFIATSTGLYSTSTLNGTSTVWAQEGSTTIGNVVCPMVKSRDSDGLVVVATHGAGVYSATQTVTAVDDELEVPSNYTLSQNYPNPFNPSTIINFSLPQRSNVQLTLFDALGRKVKDIVNKEFSVGNHYVNFNASSLSSGVYFYRLTAISRAGNFIETKKMILLK